MKEVYKYVDKYFWFNVVDEKTQPGIFSFDEISEFIKSSVKDRENLGVLKFVDVFTNKEKEKLNHFINLIHSLTNVETDRISEAFNTRLVRTYHGLFGEAVLENMYEKSSKYEVLNVSKEDDYNMRVDLKIKQKSTQKILYIQVKSSSYLEKPNVFQQEKMKEEKEIHEKLNIPVSYAFYNHDFQNRNFVIDDMLVPIFGYGNSNIKLLEEVTDVIFKKKKNLLQEKVTVETIIF